MSRRAAFATLLAFVPAALVAQPAVTPPEILQHVAASVTPEVGFREVRTLKMLKAPLVSSGRLRYAANGRLERETTHPVPEVVVIDGTRVTIERAGTTTELGLIGGSPQASLVQALRAILGGQVGELDTLYRASAEGSLDHWTMHLEPRAAGGAVRTIRLSGSSGVVGEIEVLERSGDKSVTTLTR